MENYNDLENLNFKSIENTNIKDIEKDIKFLIEYIDNKNEFKNNIYLFVLIDLLEYINEQLPFVNSFLDIDFSNYGLTNLVNGSYNCNRYKDLELNKKYLHSIYDLLNELSLNSNYLCIYRKELYSYQTFKDLFFENIELFTVKFLRFLFINKLQFSLELYKMEKLTYSYDIFKINLIDFVICSNDY